MESQPYIVPSAFSVYTLWTVRNTLYYIYMYIYIYIYTCMYIYINMCVCVIMCIYNVTA